MMPFRFMNALAIFMDLMNRVFKLVLDKCVIVLIDDKLVYSKSLTKHATCLTYVLETLDNTNSMLSLANVNSS